MGRASLFQSTRPRGARLSSRGSPRFLPCVSIHAPAWGATITSSSATAPPDRFQSTRPRGARPPVPAWWSSAPRSFNPRARVGRDAVRQHPGLTSLVSIHAPAWGATRDRPGIGTGFGGFNPRARVGRDREGPSRRSAARSFNPRARVGRDCCSSRRHRRRFRFQSTRPRGARHHSAAAVADRHQVSIHAPAWGATSTPSAAPHTLA